ncbi:hypothetical protein [Lichenibacterium dinghuense]|uniref:hypothetical protein n=1 Tax=Lichenibacterium dinghuense TaxID=2895977 RepID=UPI001F26CBCF|nr:hypothetical protein [Lichenibacterium sp. 6Y81]
MTDFGDIAGKLLTLEIDTIVSDGIAAERMPTDGQALIRIAQLYKDFLGRAIGEVRDAGSTVAGLPGFRGEDGGTTAFDDWDVATGGLRTFGTLRRAAQACQTARAAVPRPNGMRGEHEPILARVAGSCGDIQAILRRMGLKEVTIDEPSVEWAEESGTAWPAFDRDTILALRRIWETGVDVIVMQTMVRLDGGVTTRVLDGWDGPEAAPVHDLHYRGVDIALARWGFLVQTAKDLAGFFFPGGSDRGGGGTPALPPAPAVAR